MASCTSGGRAGAALSAPESSQSRAKMCIRDSPAWSEEVVLTCMSYMAVLSAALAIRRGAHIRMTAFDVYLPKMVVKALDILADVAVMVLGIIMMVVGWNYATTLGGRGFYVSMPWLSRFWMYFPVPLAGVAMIVFEFESIYNHIKSLFVKEEV